MEDIKQLEQERKELDEKIKQYYIDEEESRIKNNEEKYVGKCYKIINDKETIYFKFISGLTNNTHCYMHRMLFKLPIDLEFKLVYRTPNTNRNKFEYEFYGDILDFSDESMEPIGHHDHRIEISIEEFEEALMEFGKQLLEVSREDFTINSKYFKG